MASSPVCRWGILGTAGIARKNWQAIARSGNAALVAVASRSRERSLQFVEECQAACPVPLAPAALGSYDELLGRSDVDAVYIPLPTGVRKEWVMKAAAAKKHVLVEKPVGRSAGDVRDMLAACARNRVQFMDGVMFMHSRRLDALRHILDDGTSVGPIRRIAAQFSFGAPPGFVEGNIRANSALEPQGCLGDLGWYTIRFALWALRYELPTRVSAHLLDEARHPESPESVPFEVSAELDFGRGVTAAFYCSFRAGNQQWANVSGELGYLHVPDFVLPFSGDELRFEVTNSRFEVRGCDFAMERRSRTLTVDERSNSHATAQETNLFRAFSRLVAEERLDPHWGEVALKTQLVLDACWRSAREGRPVEVA